jgi:TRAP transporter TAXI family solute receptor
MGQLGNLTVYLQASAYLDAIGVKRDDIESWGGTIYQLPRRASMDLLKDDKADAAFSAGFHPDASVLELARATPVVLLPFGKSAINRVANQFNAQIVSIPEDAYDFLNEDYPSTAFSAYIVAGPSTDHELVYKVVKSIHAHFGILQGMHPSLAQSDQSMLSMHGAFQLHPAARQFYREAELIE